MEQEILNCQKCRKTRQGYEEMIENLMYNSNLTRQLAIALIGWGCIVRPDCWLSTQQGDCIGDLIGTA